MWVSPPATWSPGGTRAGSPRGRPARRPHRAMQMRRLWLPALRAVKGHRAQGVWHNSSSEMPPLRCPPPQFKYPLQWGALQGLARPFPSPFSGPFSVLQPLPLLKPGAEPSTDALWVCTQLGPHSSNSGPWGDLERKSSELPMLAATRGKSRDRWCLEHGAAGQRQDQQPPSLSPAAPARDLHLAEGSPGLAPNPGPLFTHEHGELAVKGVPWSPAMGCTEPLCRESG